MGTNPPARQPIGFRYQYLWAALTAIGTISGVFVLLRVGSGSSGPQTPATTLSSIAAGPVNGLAATVPSSQTAVQTAGGPRLGRDVMPIGSEACRSPNIAAGAAWQLGEVHLSGRSFDTAYTCNLLSGGGGSLDFDLQKAYRELQISFGFADGQGATNQAIKFEIIGNDAQYLTEPRTLRFGEDATLSVNTVGVSRLRLKISEQNPAGGSGSPSRPVLADLRLTPT